MQFSDNAHLVIDTPVRELSDVQGYMIQTIAKDWEQSQGAADTAHWRSVRKVVEFLEEKYDVTNIEYGSKEWRKYNEFMSEDLRNIEPYGMTPVMVKNL